VLQFLRPIKPAVVEKIIELIGFETPLESTSSLLQAYRAVYKCSRGPKEPLDRFFIRFRGVASIYLELENVSASSQDSQLLAVVLLQNAELTPDTQHSTAAVCSVGAAACISGSTRSQEYLRFSHRDPTSGVEAFDRNRVAH
jgi:hypothetical protein